MSALDNRTVVITGAGCGIGRATALRFAERGAIVIVTDIDMARAQETLEHVRERAGSAYSCRVDVADMKGWERFARQLESEHGVPDVLVNNAGYTTAGRFFDHSAEDWERLMAVNVMGVIQGSRVLGARMIDAGVQGNIINVASGAAYIPIPLSTLYCTTKTAVLMASECLRAELAGYGIGVTAICPGFINTGFYDAAEQLGVDDEEAEERRSLTDGVAKRIAHDPDLVARAILDASRKNPAVKPVALEAEIGYLLSRLSPGLLRAGMRYVKADNVASLARQVVPEHIRDWVSRPSLTGASR